MKTSITLKAWSIQKVHHARVLCYAKSCHFHRLRRDLEVEDTICCQVFEIRQANRQALLNSGNTFQRRYQPLVGTAVATGNQANPRFVRR